MAKRINLTDPFANEIQPDQADQQLYGAVDIGKSARRDRIKSISIYNILPDPHQPRRALPIELRMDHDVRQMAEVMGKWLNLAGLDVRTLILKSIDESDYPTLTTPLQRALLPIIQLAASIRLSGLANPVTVVQHGNSYHLETGERRWMAYHLLEIVEPGDWEELPARVMDEPDIWRQAAENNARENLNAIGRARQLALLLMDEYSRDGVEFEILQAFQEDVDFYAQVADGNQFSIPRGMGAQFAAAVGVKHPQQLREYRDLLRLPAVVWRIADDLDWPQGKLRSLRRQAVTDEQLASLAIISAHQEGYTVGIPTLDEIDTTQFERVAKNNPQKAVKQATSWLLKRHGSVKTLSKSERKKAQKNLDSLQKWIDQYRAKLDQ